MKHVLIIPHGAADDRIGDLEDRTPLDAARTPNLDAIATEGRQGTVVTIPPDFPPHGDVAALSLLGYDPVEHYTGRAALEAVASGLKLTNRDLVFRCNLVTVVGGRIADPSAGRIGDTEATELIRVLNEKVAPEGIRFHTGRSYRNLMVVEGGAGLDIKCTPPHAIPDAPISAHMPRGKDARRFAEIIAKAAEVLAEQDINDVRRDLGENPATGIWLWGQGVRRALPRFRARFGIEKGVMIAAMEMMHGLARSIGFDVLEAPGATGMLDTNYRGKGDVAVAALDDFDFVVLHIAAPDHASHLGDAVAKVHAIEQIDEHVVGPVLERIRAYDRWRILIAAGYPTPTGTRVHSSTPPPFCIAGTDVHSVLARPFNEANAEESDLHVDPGHELMEFFLKR